MTEPIAEPIATNGESGVTSWDEARPLLEKAQQYWLATVDAEGRPHVVPVFGICAENAMHFTARPATRKARDLAENTHCVMTVSIDQYDLMVEGIAIKVRDVDHLQRIASLYHSKYDWPVTVKDGAYDAPYAAPAAGQPPTNSIICASRKRLASTRQNPTALLAGHSWRHNDQSFN